MFYYANVYILGIKYGRVYTFNTIGGSMFIQEFTSCVRKS